MTNESQVLVQNTGISKRVVDEHIFLISDSLEVIIYLNVLADSIWEQFATPADVNDIIALVLAAYPDEDEAEITEHVNYVIDDLLDFDLLVPRQAD